MQQAQCPDCGAHIGGQNHTLAGGVGRADKLEGMLRGMRI